MKSTSLFALVSAAGLALSMASVNAADLGGNCCADLEERVAELEATTVRKGNRKVSLTLSGQVNRAIMHWNDGFNSNTYYGLDNTNSSSRFNLSGNAKINAEWSAGFNMTIDVADKARTFSVSNNGGAEDANSQGPGGGPNGDQALRLRDANWWIQSDRLGRTTVGRLTTSGAVAGIDMSNVQLVASSSPGLVGGGMIWRNAASGAATPVNINATTDGGAYPTTRAEGVKWTSPTLAGFQVSASVAEASNVEFYSTVNQAGSTTGRNVGIDLKYAGEFNGVRIAAGIGYEEFSGNGDGILNIGGPGAHAAGDLRGMSTKNVGGALALMHVPTGLFIQGDYLRSENTNPLIAAQPNGFAGEREATRYIVQAGLVRNFFGIGNTTLYGEVGKASDWVFARGLAAVSGDATKWWGLGITQNIDAAAMELYAGYRNFSGDVPNLGVVVKDIDILTVGARIKF